MDRIRRLREAENLTKENRKFLESPLKKVAESLATSAPVRKTKNEVIQLHRGWIRF